MELKIVEEPYHQSKVFDTSAAVKNRDKYDVERRGLESALERTNFELKNAEKVLEILTWLSYCWRYHANPERYFFFTHDGLPALPEEFRPEGRDTPNGYISIPLAEVKKIKCPGCTEVRELIGYYVSLQASRDPGKLVLCGNSVHIIKSHNG